MNDNDDTGVLWKARDQWSSVISDGRQPHPVPVRPKGPPAVCSSIEFIALMSVYSAVRIRTRFRTESLATVPVRCVLKLQATRI